MTRRKVYDILTGQLGFGTIRTAPGRGPVTRDLRNALQIMGVLVYRRQRTVLWFLPPFVAPVSLCDTNQEAHKRIR
jgi:hypothetical protein